VTRPSPLTRPWHPVACDELGGWAVATTDQPTSRIDRRTDTVVAALIPGEILARHIADLHNTALGGAS
jgi:hypothetical protein